MSVFWAINKKRFLRGLEQKAIIVQAFANSNKINQIYEFSANLEDYGITEEYNIEIKNISLSHNRKNDKYYINYPKDLLYLDLGKIQNLIEKGGYDFLWNFKKEWL